MADSRYLKNSFIAISRPGIIRFPWNLVCGLKFWFKDGHMLIYKKIMKFRMADSRHIENRILAISPRVIVWLTRYLVCTSRTKSDTGHVTKIAIFENLRWRTAAILKMVSSLYILSHGSSDFNEIWCATADFGSKDMTKYQNFANSKWRTAVILKIVFFLLYLNDLLSN